MIAEEDGMEGAAKQEAQPKPEKPQLKVKERGKRPPQVTWKEQEQLTRWMEDGTPIFFKLIDGSILVGKLKWYDQYVMKILLVGGEALTVHKHSILYYRQAREGEGSELR